jgi:hypothetical protein
MDSKSGDGVNRGKSRTGKQLFLHQIKPFLLHHHHVAVLLTQTVAEASIIMSPRPILKRSELTYHQSRSTPIYPRASVHSTHGVHFPPSPSLTRTFSAHSPSLYDRSPITVSPNSCALPERGCPGRTYTLDDAAPKSTRTSWRPAANNGRHLHPRAVTSAYRESSPDIDQMTDEDEAQRTPTSTYPILPPLIPDLSSESDESDGFTSPPSDYAFYSNPCSYFPPPHSHPIAAPSHPPIPYASHRIVSYSNEEAYFSGAPNPLSFLPHPPSPSDDQKARRRKQRSRDQSRSRSRDGRQGSSDSRRGVDGSYKSFSVCKALANCSIDSSDDGCLGGF